MLTTSRFDIALLGFSAFERSAFESFFRLSARRTPSYAHAQDLLQADAVIVDMDEPEAVRQLDALGLRARALCVGSRALRNSLGQLPRPINMMAIMKILDSQLASLQTNAATRSAKVVPLPSPKAPDTPPRASNESYLSALASMAAADKHQPDEILVVDDSDIALRFMAQHLYRYGFHVNLCHSGEEALERVALRHYTFVFMDVNMPGMDGYSACRRIKQMAFPADRVAPAVVMLTSRGGAFDKLRGSLAGCDAYLTKPLKEEALLRVIGDHITTPAGQRRLG